MKESREFGYTKNSPNIKGALAVGLISVGGLLLIVSGQKNPDTEARADLRPEVECTGTQARIVEPGQNLTQIATRYVPMEEGVFTSRVTDEIKSINEVDSNIPAGEVVVFPAECHLAEQA